MNVTPHIAQNTHGGRRRSNVDGRTTRHKGYNMSIIRRRLIEQIFGWMKQPGRMKRARHHGLERVGWFTRLVGAGFNLVRMAKLQELAQAA